MTDSRRFVKFLLQGKDHKSAFPICHSIIKECIGCNPGRNGGGLENICWFIVKKSAAKYRDKCENFFENQMEEHYFGRCVGPYDYFFVF